MAAARWLGWEIHFSNEASKLGPRNPGFGEFGIVIKDGRIDVIAICSIVRKRRATAGISFEKCISHPSHLAAAIALENHILSLIGQGGSSV